MKIQNYIRTVFDEIKEKNVRTDHLCPELKFPAHLQRLAPDQQRDVLQLLQQLSPLTQQQVLNEWDMRCQRGEVIKPAAYLFGLLKKARHEEFRPHACFAVREEPPVQNNAPNRPSQPTRTGMETSAIGQKNIDQIRARHNLRGSAKNK